MTLNFTPEQEQYLQLVQTQAYHKGLRDGVHRYAHWRDGEQYVGSTGRTLVEALTDINRAEEHLLEQYNRLNML